MFSKIGMKVLPAVSFLLPALAFAQIQPGPGPQSVNSPITNLNGVTGAICTAINWVFTFLIILVVLFVLVAAFRYLTSGGDPEKTGKAKSALIYAVVAVVIAIIAKGVPLIVGSYFGVTAFSGC